MITVDAVGENGKHGHVLTIANAAGTVTLDINHTAVALVKELLAEESKFVLDPVEETPIDELPESSVIDPVDPIDPVLPVEDAPVEDAPVVDTPVDPVPDPNDGSLSQ